MKVKVKRKDLQLISQGKASSEEYIATKASVKRSRDEHIRTELDLRGMSLEESIIEVDKFLDESFLANLDQVNIIHGKGTGVLRNGIHEYLRKHKLVKQFRLGQYGEGGSGITVVEL